MADFWPGLFGFGKTKIAVGSVEDGEIAMRHLTGNSYTLLRFPKRVFHHGAHEIVRLLCTFPEFGEFFGVGEFLTGTPTKVNRPLRATTRVPGFTWLPGCVFSH